MNRVGGEKVRGELHDDTENSTLKEEDLVFFIQ